MKPPGDFDQLHISKEVEEGRCLESGGHDHNLHKNICIYIPRYSNRDDIYIYTERYLGLFEP